ncbi:MAG: MarR family winged helix-turn-helix transcriptional regulator [Pseudomonas sp.]|uniref:MarR family winged helix-turn-helix transcriptional regulator n=1 Tax=Pseudomonas sp. TaxID=306 RepID=UPI0033975AF6
MSTEHLSTEPSQACAPTTDFCLRLARAHAVLIRRLDSALGSYHGISFSDYQVLYYLSRAPAARLRRVDLAERLGLTASGVTRTLLPLEKIGLISREPDPRDARVGYAVVTPTGQELMRNARSIIDQISHEQLKNVPAAELAGMAAVLGQLAGIDPSNS